MSRRHRELVIVPWVSKIACAALFSGLPFGAGACGDASTTLERDPAVTRAVRQKPATRLQPTPCPADLANCHSASGRIVYVEAVDPDGDGDAHFVLASRQSITAPGITVVDVRVDLRPEPLPGIGDRLSAAGQVFPGSYGQHQIEAVAVHVARG
jgi:hypothetical protein